MSKKTSDWRRVPFAALAWLAITGCATESTPDGQAAPTPSPSSAAPEPPTTTSTSASAPAAVEERWGGRIRVPGQTPLEFELHVRPGQPALTTMAIPAQKLDHTTLTDVTFEASSMRFTLALPGSSPEAHARFEIEHTSGQPISTGTMKQHGATMDVQVRRLAAGETVGDGRRAQTPQPPFPYDEHEARYESKDGTRLAGTLTVPRGGGKHPAVVLITGTGEQDRDATLAGHKLFFVLADHLTRAGIAALRVDDRGVGRSFGDTNKTDLNGKVDDVLAGVAWLASRPDIETGHIGLVGHSEGGLIAPLAATRSADAPDVAFVVLLAGPGVPLQALLRKQMADSLRAQRVSPERYAIGMSGQNRVIDAVLAGADDASLRRMVTTQVDAVLQLLTAEQRARIDEGARKAMIESAVLQVASPAMRSFIRADPAPALEKLRCPVLALGGTLDLQVPPDENLAGMLAALERGKNPDVTTQVLPGLNHLFQPARSGTMDEWATIDTTIDPAALERIATWIRARTGLGTKP